MRVTEMRSKNTEANCTTCWKFTGMFVCFKPTNNPCAYLRTSPPFFINSYVIYQLTKESFQSAGAWIGSSRFLLLASPWTDDLSGSLRQYLTAGGQCLSLHPVAANWFANDEEREGDVRKLRIGSGLLVSPLADEILVSGLATILQRDFQLRLASGRPVQDTSPSVGHVIAEPFHEEAFFQNLKRPPSEDLTFHLNESKDDPVLVRRVPTTHGFDAKEYFGVISI